MNDKQILKLSYSHNRQAYVHAAYATQYATTHCVSLKDTRVLHKFE